MLQRETSHLQAQIFDLQNQNSEYELRFKRMSFGANFRTLETTSTFVDGKQLPWKFDNEKEAKEGSERACCPHAWFWKLMTILMD